MKKFLTLMLSAMLAVACCFSLVGCGHTHNFVGKVESKGTCTQTGKTVLTCECGAKEEKVTPALGHAYKDGKCIRCNAAAPTVTPASTVKVGLICLHDENSTYDKNFIDAMVEATNKLGVTLVKKTGVPEGAECKEEALSMAASGCNVIFADSFGHESYLLEAAKQYPNVQFYHATGTKAHTTGVANFHNAFADIYQGRYLAGVVAGLKLQQMIANDQLQAKNYDSGVKGQGNIKLGYIGAFTYAEVISGFTSWYLGVKSVISKVVMDVQFTGSWYDETGEKAAANTLISKGCAIISQHADSWGSPTACEAAGVPNVSYNGSTAENCPETFLVSSKINWEPYFEYIINNAKNGVLSDTDYCKGLVDGSAQLTEYGKNVAPDTAATIEHIKAQLIAGTIKVFDCSTFTVNGAKLTSYLADVDDWGDYVPDTEVIKTEGNVTYFAESEYRSAPYFDLKIDGINYLNTAF